MPFGRIIGAGARLASRYASRLPSAKATRRAVPGALGGVAGAAAGGLARTAVIGAGAGAAGYFGAQAAAGGVGAVESVGSGIRRGSAALVPAAIAVGAVYASTRMADPTMQKGLWVVAALAGWMAVRKWNGE